MVINCSLIFFHLKLIKADKNESITDTLEKFYARNLIEITYQHKLHETTVDTLNVMFQNNFIKIIEKSQVYKRNLQI